MDGCNSGEIRRLANGDKRKVLKILDAEKRFELTRSLLNLLYNIVIVGSLPVSRSQRIALDEKRNIVWQLLGNKLSLRAKKTFLKKNPDLVILIASSCPENG